MPEASENSILPEATSPPAATYVFPPSSPCGFCRRAVSTRTVHVDLNWPVLDVVKTRDASVPNLPSCEACARAYLRIDNFCVSLPRLFGYPISVVYRLLTVPGLRSWVGQHATVMPLRDPPTAGQRAAICTRFQWVAFYGALWGLTGFAAMGGYPEAAPLRGWSYLIFFAMTVLGALGCIAGILQWVRCRFAKS